MVQVLLINSNPKPAAKSFGVTLAESFIEAYRKEHPGDEIVVLNLYDIDVQEIDLDILDAQDILRTGGTFADLTDAQRDKLTRFGALTEQFIQADKYIFVSPLWNLSFPPRLKAYLDAIHVPGKTFKYSPQGPVGLLQGKKAVHIQTRGGNYSEGPAAELEFGDRFLRAALSFVGVTDLESVIAEGMSSAPQNAELIRQRALERTIAVAASF